MTQIVPAQRLNGIQPSATLSIAARARQLRHQGRDIISLSTGEPDFDTPDVVKAAAIEAIESGFTKYTPVDGIVSLKEAITLSLQRDWGLDYHPDAILASCGAKHSIYNALQALINPGDEVVLPAPYWVSYPDMIRLSGGVPRIINTSAPTYRITAESLQQAITAQTKLVIFNSPSNPTGMAYRAEELGELAQVLHQHPHVAILSDDIYAHIVWDHTLKTHLLQVSPELKDRTLVINGVSKAYAMTGWRIGYAAGPKAWIAHMKTIQSQSTSNPNSIAQKAAVAALNMPLTAIQPMIETFKRRHDRLIEALRTLPAIELQPADGTFYLFPDVQASLQQQTDVAFCEALLEQTGLALVPGTAFGAPGHVRLSFAADDETLAQAVDRLRMFCHTRV